jgi:hypothetical protein
VTAGRQTLLLCRFRNVLVIAVVLKTKKRRPPIVETLDVVRDAGLAGVESEVVLALLLFAIIPRHNDVRDVAVVEVVGPVDLRGGVEGPNLSDDGCLDAVDNVVIPALAECRQNGLSEAGASHLTLLAQLSLNLNLSDPSDHLRRWDELRPLAL